MISQLVFFLFCLAFCAPVLFRHGRRIAEWLFVAAAGGVFLFFLSLLPKVTQGGSISGSVRWIPSLNIDLSFRIDGLSLLFALIISGIGALVLLYSRGYLKGHPLLGRFYLYILLFMASMLGVVLCDNILTLFVFWELTSLSSYLLIGFDHRSEKSRWAALQALLVTGIGGLALLAGFLLLGHVAGSYEIDQLLTTGQVLRSNVLYVPIVILILIGAFTKSAQAPFHFWLPGAMVAPAPVSTYLHSATMVKAGVYLLARFTPILGGTSQWAMALTVFGGLTMFVGAVLALRQSDLKLMLAYSTVSALGTLVLLLGIGTSRAIEAAVVYLLVHALYKGSLFMTAGIVDHATGKRHVGILGGLIRRMPATALAAALAALSMAGLPPFLGYFSKELIYDAELHLHSSMWLFVSIALVANAVNVAVAIFTGIKPFWGPRKDLLQKPHRVPAVMWTGPFVLALLGLLFGLFPNSICRAFFRVCAESVDGHHSELVLQLWHGLNTIVLLSVSTLSLGVLFYLVKRYLPDRRFAPLAGFTPSALFKRGLDAILVFAGRLTRLLQSGNQRYYLLTIFFVTFFLIAFRLFDASQHLRVVWTELHLYELALGILMLLAAGAAVLTGHRLAAVISLGVVGYGVAMIYIFFGAPDLAITQILVETLVVILFVLVIYRLPRFKTFSRTPSRIRDIILALCGGTVMTALTLSAVHTQVHSSISRFFAENSVNLGHGRNIVNVILVDFRAIDTLGETTVLSVAAIGVVALLRFGLKTGRDR